MDMWNELQALLNMNSQGEQELSKCGYNLTVKPVDLCLATLEAPRPAPQLVGDAP